MHTYVAQTTGIIALLRYTELFSMSLTPFSVLWISIGQYFSTISPSYLVFFVTSLMIKWVDFCSPWVINPIGLERLQKGSHREAFVMDSHRDTSIHRANEIVLQEQGFREEEENSEDLLCLMKSWKKEREGVSGWETSWFSETHAKTDLTKSALQLTFVFLIGTNKKKRKTEHLLSWWGFIPRHLFCVIVLQWSLANDWSCSL